MDIWILECDIPNECEKTISIWDSEDHARQQACADIQDEISNAWMPPSCSAAQLDLAKEINEHIAAGRWEKAMNSWNHSSLNDNSDNPIYWGVRTRPIRTTPCDPLVRAASSFDPDDSESEKAGCDHEDCCGCDHIDCEGKGKTKAFVATKPGASCRRCPHVSEYAFADRADGTFICRSCKMMMDVFTPGD
jgi:hypothetical protein